MDSLDRFVAETRVLLEAETIIQCASLKVAEEKLAANPELRQAVVEHFRREALRDAMRREDPE